MDIPAAIIADKVNLTCVSIAGPDAIALAVNINRIIASIAAVQPDVVIVGFDLGGSGDGANYLATMTLSTEIGQQEFEIPITEALALTADTGEAGGDVSAPENIDAFIAAAPATLAEVSALLMPSASLFTNAIAALLPQIGLVAFLAYGFKVAGATSGRRFMYLTIGHAIGPSLEETIQPLAAADTATPEARAIADVYNLRAGKKRTPEAIERTRAKAARLATPAPAKKAAPKK
jgi:hypothetical protein